MEAKHFLKKYAHLYRCAWFSDLHLYVLVLDCLAVGYRNTRELGDISSRKQHMISLTMKVYFTLKLITQSHT